MPNLISIVVRRGNFHRGRQIEHDPVMKVFARGAPSSLYSRAYFDDILGFGLGEGLDPVNEPEPRPVFFAMLINERSDEDSMGSSELDDLFLALSEHDFPKAGCSGVEETDDHLRRPSDSLEGAVDKVGPSWCHNLRVNHCTVSYVRRCNAYAILKAMANLYPDILGYSTALNEGPDEFELGFARGRVGNLDLLETTLHKMLE